jgi:hypothetical protein
MSGGLAEHRWTLLAMVAHAFLAVIGRANSHYRVK